MRQFEKHHFGPICNGCNDRLEDAVKYLSNWFAERKELDNTLHVSWAHRDEAAQNEAFNTGHSHLKWPLSKHNKLPAQAIDLFQINEKKNVVYVPMTYARMNDESAKAGWTLRWGGSFKKLGDYCHFETVDA